MCKICLNMRRRLPQFPSIKCFNCLTKPLTKGQIMEHEYTIGQNVAVKGGEVLGAGFKGTITALNFTLGFVAVAPAEGGETLIIGLNEIGPILASGDHNNELN